MLAPGKLNKQQDVSKLFENTDAAKKAVKLEAFSKFSDTTEALDAAAALLEASLSKDLSKFLKKNVKKSELIKKIREKFNSIYHFCLCV